MDDLKPAGTGMGMPMPERNWGAGRDVFRHHANATASTAGNRSGGFH